MPETLLSRLKTCLIVDDDEICRETLQMLLRSCGLVCRIAENGMQAWAMIKTSPPDLLVTDMQMPRLNGLELLEKCRKAEHHFFAIIMSGVSHTINPNLVALNSCCAAILPKPVSMRALTQCLRAADRHEHFSHCVHSRTRAENASRCRNAAEL